MKEPRIWYGLQAGLVLFWLAVPLAGLLGLEVPYLVPFAALILAAHVLEIPLALGKLKGLSLPTGQVALKTLLFGFTWWLPVSKGYIKG